MDKYYSMALFSGFFYALCGLFIKRAINQGTGILRILFLSRWISLIMILPIFLIDPTVHDWSVIWGAFLAALFAFTGWIFVLAGIRMGEVSIQMPLMGTKVLFVAIFSLLLIGDPISSSIWTGTILTFSGILILGAPSLLKKNLSLIAVFCALISSPLFALTDVLISKYAHQFGEPAFLFITFIFLALFSLFLIPFFKQPLQESPSRLIKWGVFGAFFMALEEVLILYALAFSAKPTGINTLYNSRGVWTVLIVWLIGHWFGNMEKKSGWKTMSARLVGSILLCAAILIILWT